MYRFAVVLTLCFPLTVLSSLEGAAKGVGCHDQAFLMDNEFVAFVGKIPAVAEPGDRRILRWRVYEDAGEKVGDFHVLTTILSQSKAGDWVRADGSIAFSNGTIHATVLTVLRDPSDTTKSSSTIDDYVVVGGSGEFANAKGIIRLTPPHQSHSRLNGWLMELKLDCS